MIARVDRVDSRRVFNEVNGDKRQERLAICTLCQVCSPEDLIEQGATNPTTVSSEAASTKGLQDSKTCSVDPSAYVRAVSSSL